jgi:endonuclease/exonuclease/phosphatase family metal-dependent hydrolase
MIIRKVLSSLFGLSLIGTSVALVGAAAAPYTDPETFDWLAFLGLMYPFLLLLHIALFIVYTAISRNKKSLLFLIPALFTTHLFLNSFGTNFFRSTSGTSRNQLKLMTYNVHMFKDADDIGTDVQLPIIQLIQAEQPDILCMQDFQNDRGVVLNPSDSIKTLLKASYYYDGPKDLALFPTQSIATISRYPIVNSGYILFSNSSGGNQAIYTDINKNEKIIRVYNTHFQSLGFQPEDYEEWRNADVLGKLKFLFKVKDKFSHAFINRSRQVKMVKKHAKSCKYPIIIEGDFNDTPSSFAVNYTMQGMKNAFREKGRGYAVTFNGGLPDFQIDYIMVNPIFQVMDYHIIRKRLSDHYPVIVKLGYE